MDLKQRKINSDKKVQETITWISRHPRDPLVVQSQVKCSCDDFLLSITVDSVL